MSDYRETALWRSAFLSVRGDKHGEARAYFRTGYERLRERVIPLVGRIAVELPQLTIHDVSHLDSLWETASEIAGEKYKINPAEAFVLGGAILLHDAAMCAAAYQGGLAEIKAAPAWRDCAVPLLRSAGYLATDAEIANPPASIFDQVLFSVLRDQHAVQAEMLATMDWPISDGRHHLIENADLRAHYGGQIGRIAHSHHWSTGELADKLQMEVPAIALPDIDVPTRWVVDSIKVACLLRTADAAHIDARRAPRHQRLIVRPAGISEQHWKFQERLGKARLDKRHAALRFGTGRRFDLPDADAWFLCFDAIQLIDRELREADRLLDRIGTKRFGARGVFDADCPTSLARHVQTHGWIPVDTQVHISDVTAVVQRLGGEQLYGRDPSIALRELIQNSADAIRARREVDRGYYGGRITIRLRTEHGQTWLDVEDDGIGMSEHVLVGALLDFGRSFWRVAELRREWPGLAGSNFQPTGRFGIGFFSVFMLGEQIVVTSRRFDDGAEHARSLEFRHGLELRPILRDADNEACKTNGGTKVSIKLNSDCHREGRLLAKPRDHDTHSVPVSLETLDVDVWVEDFGKGPVRVVEANDWTRIPSKEVIGRSSLQIWRLDDIDLLADRMTSMVDEDGKIYGRAALAPELLYGSSWSGVVSVGGLRGSRRIHVAGVMLGSTDRANRQVAEPTIPAHALSTWAESQTRALTGLPLFLQGEAAEAAALLGASTGALKWLRIGTDALAYDELAERLSGMTEILICDGLSQSRYGITVHVEDRVPARIFAEQFVPDENVLELFGGGSFLDTPPDLTVIGRAEANSYLRGRMRLLVLEIIRAWNVDLMEKREKRRVGGVGRIEIRRDVTVIRRSTRVRQP